MNTFHNIALIVHYPVVLPNSSLEYPTIQNFANGYFHPITEQNGTLLQYRSSPDLRVISDDQSPGFLDLNNPPPEIQIEQSARLIMACEQNDLSMIKELIKDSTIDLHLVLNRASELGHLDIVKELLSHGRIDPSDRYYESIHMSMKHGHKKIMGELIKHLLDGKKVFSELYLLLDYLRTGYYELEFPNAHQIRVEPMISILNIFRDVSFFNLSFLRRRTCRYHQKNSLQRYLVTTFY